MSITLVAKTALGLERVCAHEIEALTDAHYEVRNGEVLVAGDEALMARLNLGLRTAERVTIRLHEAQCSDFDELFEQASALPWGDLLPSDARIVVNGTSRNSELRSIRTMQSMIKKAVVVSLQERYAIERLPESGSEFEIEFVIDGPVLSLDLNTSGDGLHRRGYRIESGEAPLRETLAAALVMLSGWDGGSPLIDPFTGSGTIAIEGALLAAGIAPGFKRTFAAEKWPWLPETLWRDERARFADAEPSHQPPFLYGSDIDNQVLAVAKRNAERAGVQAIRFERCMVEQLRLDLPQATVIGNPPYGERMGDSQELRTIYGALRKLIQEKEGWSFHFLSADPDFEERVGLTPTKRRKLYNARIKAYLYTYADSRRHPNPKG